MAPSSDTRAICCCQNPGHFQVIVPVGTSAALTHQIPSTPGHRQPLGPALPGSPCHQHPPKLNPLPTPHHPFLPSLWAPTPASSTRLLLLGPCVSNCRTCRSTGRPTAAIHLCPERATRPAVCVSVGVCVCVCVWFPPGPSLEAGLVLQASPPTGSHAAHLHPTDAPYPGVCRLGHFSDLLHPVLQLLL